MSVDFTIYIITPPGYIHSHCFDELAIGLAGGLRELGYTAKEARKPEDIEGRAIVLGAHLLAPNGITIPDNAIIYNTEVYSPEWSKVWESNPYFDLIEDHTVWDYAENNIPGAIYCGVGFHEDLVRVPKVTEDIDLLFYGSINERRAAILEKLMDSGLDIKILPVGTYGAERDKWIARAKIVLNLHYYEGAPFEIVRCSYLAANSKCILSEPTTKEHNGLILRESPIIITPITGNNVVSVCQYLLKDNQARNDRAQYAFKRFSQLRQSDYLRSALEATALREQRASHRPPAGFVE